MLESRILRPPARNEPMVLAAFSYRYDAHLVPGLLENIAPSVHGYVAWDDRAADLALTPETTRRSLLLAEAKRLGARWILAVDPDERFEDSLAARMPNMLHRGESSLWMFSVREMFDPDRYRTDGVWGGKQTMRLFPMQAVRGELTVALHGRWISDSTGYTFRDARINLYHLRMVTPERRSLRRELYAAADPARVFQKIGYDYLDDERGMRLERIPEGRGFSPAFVEDGGLWSPAPDRIGAIASDRLEQRLHFVAQSATSQGHEVACHVLQDLAAASSQDDDMPLLAASHAFAAGLHELALSIASRQIDKHPESVFARVLKVNSLHRLDRHDEALAEARRLPPDSAYSQEILARLGRAAEDFAAEGASWRRWTTGAARCHEGVAVARSDLTVIIIGFRAQKTLASAVASVIEQDVPAEIVVVNTGGGDVRASLGPYLDHIRLIEIDEPLYVGAARNVGVDASRARFIAFLAGDCLAAPGWCSIRLHLHRAGALTVATPVMPEVRATLVAEAGNRLLYWGRRPETPLAWIAPFGRSYHRRLLDLVGPFAPGVRINEDALLNRAADRIASATWASGAITRHRDPATLLGLLRAQVRRGANRADHPPFRAMAVALDCKRRLADEMRGRLAASLQALRWDPSLGNRRRRMLAVVQWLANLADRSGIARGLARIAAAERLVAEGSAPESLARAAALDPQDWRKAHKHASALADASDDAAIAEFRRALALAPGEAAPLAGLVRYLERQGDAPAALRAAERAALAAPLSRKSWEIASDTATRAGRGDLALAFALQALALAPNLATAHQRTARCHASLGNPVAALFRTHAAQRLEQDAARAAGEK